jgi:hypothetical protein
MILFICYVIFIQWNDDKGLGKLIYNTYCVVFLFCFSSTCVPYAASFSWLSISDCPFGIL